MKITKNNAYKTLLIPANTQKQLLFNHIFVHNQTWNILLSQKEEEYNNNQILLKNNLDPVYLKSVEQDNIVKNILKSRLLIFNTKVIQQCR